MPKSFFSTLGGLFGIGRPAKPSPKKKVGAPGTAIFGGYIEHHEKDPKLTGLERYRTFSNMLANISIIAAACRYFLNLAGKPKWTAEAVDESPAAIEVAEFIEDVLADMQTPWPRIVRRASMYRFWGFSIQEWTAKTRDDGKIGFLDVEPRSQKTIEQWDRDENGIIVGMVQRDPQTSAPLYLPRGKVLYMVDDSLDDSPEGLGLFRHAAETAGRLKRVQDLELMGFETDLKGIPVGRAPLADLKDQIANDEATEKEVEELLGPLKEVIENHIRTHKYGILMDSDTYTTDDEKEAPSSVKKWDLDLLKGGSMSLADANKAIVRMTLELARLFGVEHLLLGDQGRGSLALAKDKSHNFGLIVDSTLGEVAWSVTKDLVTPVLELNGISKDLMPTLKIEQVQYRDVEQITQALANMASAGALIEPGDPVVPQVRDLMGLKSPDTVAMDDDASLMPDKKTGATPEPDVVPDPEPEPEPEK